MRRMFSLAMLLFVGIAGYAQNVTGTVTSATDGSTLPGVTVLVKGTNIGTNTDADGKFALEVPDAAGSILVASFIGFETQEVSVNSRTIIDIALQESSQQLQEVVVTALGIEKQKVEVNYSAEAVSGKELVVSSAPNVANALSGKVAGLQVVQPSGIEGGKTRLTIRGNTTFNGNNEPLIVVDGLQFNNDGGIAGVNSGRDWGSALNMINPEIIEDITVLKGPNAAALYGARGANGVVYITTKKGKKRPGLGIDYSLDYRISQPFGYRETQNTYGAGQPGYYRDSVNPTLPKNQAGQYVLPLTGDFNFWLDRNYGMPARTSIDDFSWFGSGMSWGAKMEGQDVLWWDGVMRKYSPQPDNLKEFYSTGHTATHNIAFSGGGEMGTFRVGFSRTDNTAITPNSNYDQTSLNIGAQLAISSKVKANVAVNYVNYNRKNSPLIGQSHLSWESWMLYDRSRDWQHVDRAIFQNVDGSRRNFSTFYQGDYTKLNQFMAYERDFFWWNIYNNNVTLGRNKLFGTISLDYEITPWLSAMGRVGLDLNFDSEETKNRPVSINGLQDGSYKLINKDLQVQNHDFLLTAHKDNFFTDMNVRLAVGGSQWKQTMDKFEAESKNWALPFLYSLENFTQPSDRTAKTDVEDKQINSVYSFLDVSYKNTWFLQVTGRNDWSSTLPSNARSYFYPSASLGFAFTELPAVKNMELSWLSFGKLRTSWARAASDASPYIANPVYTGTSYGGGQVLSLPEKVPATGLKQATTDSYEAGVNLGLFNDKIIVDFTYYRGRSYNQLLEAPISPSSGSRVLFFNTGEMTNRGIELQIDAGIVRNDVLSWDVGVRFSRNRNFVESLSGKDENGNDIVKQLLLTDGELWGPYGPAIYLRAGDQYGTIYGNDFQYAPDGQKILTPDGTHYLTTKDKVPIGNATPDFLLGVTNRITYKGLTLSALVDIKQGGDMFSGSWAYSVFAGQSPSTVYERNGNGLPYTDRDGNTANVGVILPGVFQDKDGNYVQNANVVHYVYKYAGNMGSSWGNVNYVNPYTNQPTSMNFVHSPAVFDNSYVKMREISLSYAVPRTLLSKVKIFQTLQVYVTGRDLFYLYKSLPDNLNPEGNQSGNNVQGFEWGGLPITRSYAAGLRASF